MKARPERLTAQQKQESISRDQLDIRLLKYGWHPNPLIRDLGEDIIVQIYDTGRWSGLTVFIQLKSTTSLLRHKLHKTESVSYPIEVKDLIHWAGTSTPLIIMLWDVEKEAGVWESLTVVLNTLNAEKPHWSEQTRVSVRLPLANSTNDDGLAKLRLSVAEYSYPVIAKDKSLDLSFQLQIPETEEGRKYYEEYIAFTEHGGEFTILPEYISELETSEWHQKLYGGVTFSKDHPTYVKSRPSEQGTICRIDIVSASGESASIPYVEFKAVKVGSATITLSNEHQPLPLHLVWVVARIDGYMSSFKCELTSPGLNVQELKDALSFLEIMDMPGSVLHVTFMKDGRTFSSGASERAAGISVNEEFSAIIEKLCVIQQKVGVRLALKDFRLDDATVLSIDAIYRVVTTGGDGDDTEVSDKALFARVDVEKALRAVQTGEGITLSGHRDETKAALLDTEFDLGPADWRMTILPQHTEAELVEVLSKMGLADNVALDILIRDQTIEFLNWIRR